VLARQAFCHLSQSSSPFCVAVFEMGSHFMPSLAWTTILLFVLPGVDGIIGMYHGTPPLVEMGSCELLPRLTFNHDPPNLCLLSS
jgi:amino acid permease